MKVYNKIKSHFFVFVFLTVDNILIKPLYLSFLLELVLTAFGWILSWGIGGPTSVHIFKTFATNCQEKGCTD